MLSFNKIKTSLWFILITVSITACGQKSETENSVIESCFETSFYKNPNAYDAMENELIASNLLKDSSASSYKELFCMYQPEYNNAAEPYYRSKQKLAEIFQNNFKGSDDALTATDNCMREATTKEKFEKTKVKEFMSLYSEIQQKMASRNIPEKWQDIETIPDLYRKELSEDFFENSDVRLSSIFILNHYLRNYTIEDMEREIVRSYKINAQDEVEKEKEEEKKPTDPDELEIIVIEGDGNPDDDIIIQKTSVEE
ncbi:hypothetical protein [Aequorivita capsosiphonis]|uniref:hypothetical protein n=1 Tax=Aequorivita capsosiphonis TaxID=487317 RepID=UPI0004136052|nr:hypothetical protein [Aequorivita capsosiphonis]